MDASERLVEQFLKGLGLGPVVHEPEKGKTPDFLVNGRIAVEVRRLNQNYEHATGYVGLEEAQMSFQQFMEKLLPSFGLAPDGDGWWVSYYFRRPLNAKAIRREIRTVLKAFQNAPSPEGLELSLGANFKLKVLRAGIPVEHFYKLGAHADRDAGGFVVAEIIRNLKLCITEKAAKIALRRTLYPEWWLVLPDYIGPDLNAHEREGLRGAVQLQGLDKVILLHPQDVTRALEI